MVVKIRRDNDPFKKYWWVLLLVFGAAGGWVCMPLLEAPAQTAAPAGEAALDGSGEQSLDAVENPQGAPGSALNLSMDGLGGYRRRKGDGPLASSLYQAPAEAAASTATAAAAAPAVAASAKGDLASALKFVAKRAAAPDASGWGGKAAQKGFTAPKANFGAMSGFGGGGSASAASMSAGGGGGPAVTGFGSGVAKTGLATTRGLRDDGSDSKTRGPSMNALKAAQRLAVTAAGTESLSAAASMGGRSFDGGGAGMPMAGGAAQGGASGAIDSLDRAPINLKANDPNLSKSEFKAAPVPTAAPVVDKDAQMREMIKMMLIMAVVGGLIGAVAGPMAGGMVGQMAGPMMQSQMSSGSSTTPGSH